MKNISIRLAFLVFAVSIVLPINSSVKHLPSNRVATASATLRSGNPLPVPTPPPPGFSVLTASGNPLPVPIPPPPGLVS
jgi:hypothetical protein